MRDDLEGTLDAVAAAIGCAAALRLAAWSNGQTLHVPADPADDCFVAHVVGADRARALAAAMGGERIDLPSPSALTEEIDRARTNATIAEMAARGAEGKTIARWIHASRKTVARALDEHAPAIEALKAERPRRPEIQ